VSGMALATGLVKWRFAKENRRLARIIHGFSD